MLCASRRDLSISSGANFGQMLINLFWGEPPCFFSAVILKCVMVSNCLPRCFFVVAPGMSGAGFDGQRARACHLRGQINLDVPGTDCIQGLRAAAVVLDVRPFLCCTHQ